MCMRKRTLQMLGCAALLVLVVTPATAQKPITEIRIEGNVSVSAVKILRIVRIKEGDVLVEGKVSEAIKRLFATKEFADIQAFEEEVDGGVILVISVSEHL